MSDDSCCCLNEWMIVTDSFFGKQFYQKQAQTKMVKGKMTEVAVKVSQDVLLFILIIFLATRMMRKG